MFVFSIQPALRTALVVAVLGWVSLSVSAARGGGALTSFDFDSLDVPRFSGTIEDYMVGLYGSAVIVDGARTVHERDNNADVFIATSLQLFHRGDFVIEFAEVPIIGARFEGHVIDATTADDFRFHAFHGPDEVFTFTRNAGDEVFDSGWLTFPEPVDRIIVSDNGRRDVGIDDFTVQAVPEPGTMLLALTGLVALSVRRRIVGR